MSDVFNGPREFVTRQCAYLVYYTVDDAAEEIIILSVKHPAQRRQHPAPRNGHDPRLGRGQRGAHRDRQLGRLAEAVREEYRMETSQCPFLRLGRRQIIPG